MASIHVLGGMGFDSNIYLVEDEHPFVIDTGTRYHLRKNLADVADLLPLDSIERIFLTHRHYDHTGGAAGFAEACGAEVLVHADDANSVRIGDSVSTGARNFDDDQERVDVTTVEEGHEIATGQYRFIVIHTPGHTVGSVSLYDEENATLISGDTVFTNGGIGRWDLPTGDFDQLLESVQILSELEVGPLYPGHMSPVLSRGSEHIRMSLRNLTDFTQEDLLLSRLRPLLEQGEDIVELIRKGELNKVRKRGRKTEMSERFDIGE
ncbi:MAG: MBL fold metallo-hydrolase [Thermoplasmata archaeon]|nr:MBL fold metallo-hydrolase [Thermoplasmata archaeon]